MTEPLDLKNLERRSQRYWNVDGLPELVMGLLWILWGGTWLIGQSLPHNAAWRFFWMFTPALLALSGVAATWATKKLKARITFPRAGYVAFKEPTHGQRLATAAVAIAAAAAVAGFVLTRNRADADGFGPLAAPILGVILSLAFVVASVAQRAPHMLTLAGVALALGLAFGSLHADWDSMNWFLMAIGLATAIAGGIRLRLFLKRNPLSVEARV